MSNTSAPVYLTRLRDANSRKHSFTARLKTAYQP
jgi:hypothetical protein